MMKISSQKVLSILSLCITVASISCLNVVRQSTVLKTRSFSAKRSSSDIICAMSLKQENDEPVFTFGDDDDDDDDDNNDMEEQDGDVVLFSSEWANTDDDDDDDDDYEDENSLLDEKEIEANFEKFNRWQSLSPKVKERIIKEQRAKAIANKKKREPAQDKKRRLMMQYKKAQLKKKRQSRIRRPYPFDSPDRIPLTDLEPNKLLSNGTIISLTDFGAYVDVGTECDGLLHISQISRSDELTFVAHPRQAFSPGDIVENIYVHRVSPTLKKLQLSMLPPKERGFKRVDDGNSDIPIYEVDTDDEDDGMERIGLDELALDDELWGEIKRVTNFGAYIELGAEVDGFLHFMDHPMFGTDDYKGAPPSAYMKAGQRVRVWVSDVNMEKKRIKLTALRPASLPILRRDFAY